MALGKQSEREPSSLIPSLSFEFPQYDRNFPLWGDGVMTKTEDVLVLLV